MPRLADNPRTGLTGAAQKAQIQRATAVAHRDMEKLDAQIARQLIAIYKRTAADLADRIRQHAGPDQNIALQELQSVLAQVNARLRELSQVRDQLLDDSLGQAADLGVRPLLGAPLSASAAMNVSNEALQFVRTFVAEDGLQLSDRIWRLDRGVRDEIVNAIEQAVIQGQGASQAAAQLLSLGRPVPDDLRSKVNAANAAAVSRTVGNVLSNDMPALQNAQRLFRTEINRAHGEAFMGGAAEHPDFAGFRYLLSPAHPAPDICDLLSTQNLHGLGKGVYPTRAKTPWPAHPNTLSFLEVVFKDEITEEDKAGKETSMQALAKLTPEQRDGVLGKNKHAAFRDGKLTQGMIRAPWRAVSRRIGGKVTIAPPRKPDPPPPPPAPKRQPDLEWLQNNVTASVRLQDATPEQLAAIRAGFADVQAIGGFRIGSLEWSSRSANYNGAYRHYNYGHAPGRNDSIEFNPDYAADAKSKAERYSRIWTQRRTSSLQEVQRRLEDPLITPSVKRRLTTQRKELEAVQRWSASQVSDDPLRITAAHEAGHALYYTDPAIDLEWRSQLARLKVKRIDMLRVSEYAATNHKELWSEVTAFLAQGKRNEVPDRILQAYEAALNARKP